MSWCRSIAACALVAMATDSLATVRIDLVLTPPTPPMGYEPNTEVAVDVYLVDVAGGNPGPNLYVRGAQLDFSETSNELDFMVIQNPDGEGWVDWADPGNVGLGCHCFADYEHETVTWIWPLAVPLPGAEMQIPIGGQTRAADFAVDVGAIPGTYSLDLINMDETDPNYGAFVAVGFNSPQDPTPVTNFQFGAGLTGGVMPITVVPEPSALSLLALAAAFTARSRKFRSTKGCDGPTT